MSEPAKEVLRSLRFDAVEQQFLLGLYKLMYQKSGEDKKKAAVWANFAAKVREENSYTQLECNLLSELVLNILSAGQKVLSSQTDLEAKMRAGEVQSVFKQIEVKVNGTKTE